MTETKQAGEPLTRRGRRGMDRVATKTAAERARFDEKQRQQSVKDRNKTRRMSEADKQTDIRDKARAKKIAKYKRNAASFGRKVMVSGPILAPMAVAWTGQAHFAMQKLDWPFWGGVLFAAAYELTTVFCAWMWNEARKDGYRGLEYAVAIWAFGLGAAVQQWWHYAGPGMSATPQSVTYAMMTLVGVILWKLYARLIHRRELVKKGKVPPSRARIGAARWFRYPKRSFQTWSLLILEPDLAAQTAWDKAALGPANDVRVERVRGLKREIRDLKRELNGPRKPVPGSRGSDGGPRALDSGSGRTSDGPRTDPNARGPLGSGPERPAIESKATPLPEDDDAGFTPTAAEMQAVQEMVNAKIGLSRASVCQYMRDPENKTRLGQDGIATNRATMVAAWGKQSN